MARFSLSALLAGCLAAGTALAQSPGPTDPAGPQLEPPSPPRSGTEINQPKMDEQIERGTLIDRKDVLEGETSPPVEPSNDDPPTRPDRPLQPR
jgi:hypothetical protein